MEVRSDLRSEDVSWCRFQEAVVKSKVWFVGLFLGLSVVSGVFAQVSSVHSPLRYSPETPPILTVLSNSKKSTLFADVLRISTIRRSNINVAYVSFLVPRDSTCSAADRAYLEGLLSRTSSSRYIYDHAFRGQLAIYKENERLVSVNYFPDGGDLDGRVTIDEGHPFDMELLSGKSVLITVRDGVIHVGARSVVLANLNEGDGGALDVDECAVF